MLCQAPFIDRFKAKNKAAALRSRSFQSQELTPLVLWTGKRPASPPGVSQRNTGLDASSLPPIDFQGGHAEVSPAQADELS